MNFSTQKSKKGIWKTADTNFDVDSKFSISTGLTTSSSVSRSSVMKSKISSISSKSNISSKSKSPSEPPVAASARFCKIYSTLYKKIQNQYRIGSNIDLTPFLNTFRTITSQHFKKVNIDKWFSLYFMIFVKCKLVLL